MLLALALIPNGREAAVAAIIADGGFETPDIPNSSFDLSPAGAAWSFQGNSGIIDSPSGYGAPPPPDGEQLALLQVSGTTFLSNFSQTISLPSTGAYSLSYFDAGRSVGQPGNVAYEVLLDSTPIHADATTTGQPFTLTTVPFTAAAGSHVLAFRISPLQPSGDNSAFFDDIRIIPEPASLALLTLAGLSLVLGRRRVSARGTLPSDTKQGSRKITS